MQLMLDTNTCIYIIKQQPMAVLDRFRQYRVGDIGISTITLAELRYGVGKSQHVDKNAKALDEFFIPLEIWAFDEDAARSYGNVRSALERAGTPIGARDMMIAAHALSLGVTLVISNTREFSRIPGLLLADWRA